MYYCRDVGAAMFKAVADEMPRARRLETFAANSARSAGGAASCAVRRRLNSFTMEISL